MNKPKIIAHYLPQYHPIPENDTWWGKGFTEWTNVAKAKPLYKGHIQPKLPADLGFYDLRLSETREEQAKLAKEAGIFGFCYWHYWFGDGKRLLEKPFDEVLELGKPDFPFCLGWANETWSGIWHGDDKKILIQQTYPSLQDEENHFNYLLSAFNDVRYIKVNNQPLLYIYRPKDIPDVKNFIERWNQKAIKHGFDGIHFVANGFYDGVFNDGFDAFVDQVPFAVAVKTTLKNRILRKFTKIPMVRMYQDFVASHHFERELKKNEYPSILPNWDNTPRSGVRGIVYHGSTPNLFKIHVKKVLKQVLESPTPEKIVFLKSWNEWAEGNYLEPDQLYGKAYIKALREALDE